MCRRFESDKFTTNKYFPNWFMTHNTGHTTREALTSHYCVKIVVCADNLFDGFLIIV